MKIAEYNQMMAYLLRPATGDREKLFTGSGDYAKKYLKNKDKATQDRFNKIVNDLRIDMSFDSAISEALRQIREEIK